MNSMARSITFTIIALAAVAAGFLMLAAEALLHWRWR